MMTTPTVPLELQSEIKTHVLSVLCSSSSTCPAAFMLRRGGWRGGRTRASVSCCYVPFPCSCHCVLATSSAQGQRRRPLLAHQWRRGGHGNGRDPPESGSRHGAAVDGLRQGAGGPAVVSGHHHRRRSGSLRGMVAGPRGVVRRRSRRGLVPRHAEAVVVASSEGGVRVGMVACRVVRVMHGHRALVLRALRVLPLPLVRVLVPAQRLRRREVPAAVVALELAPCAAAAAAVACTCTGTRHHHLAARCGGAAGRGSITGCGGGRDGVGWNLEAEQPDRRGTGRGRRRLRGLGADEGELREGLDGRVRRAGTPDVLPALLAHCPRASARCALRVRDV